MVDVGANVGLISKVLSILYEEVFAFEPSPQNRACLSRNLYPEFNNVVVFPYALGSSETNSWIDETLNNCGGDALVENGTIASGNIPGYKPVSIKTLDAILKEDQFSALKVDVQGYDIDVLKGGEKTIEKNKPTILVETGGNDYDNSVEIDKYLFDLGYRGVVRLAKKDSLYFHKNSPACSPEVFKELVNSHKALTKKVYPSSTELSLYDLISDVDRESDRIKSLFGS